jgi:tRNA G18 (ribose-2'-O)-methylase SpoU
MTMDEKKFGTKRSTTQLERLTVDQFRNAEKLPLIVVLDNIRSLHNIGSIFRTADAFGVEEIVLCGITACPPHREIQKTALGATESVKWRYFNTTLSAIQALKLDDVLVVGVEQVHGSDLVSDWKPNFQKRIAIVVGNEVGGIDDGVLQHCDAFIEIPQVGTKHSLNVSVSAGIVIWEAFRRLR